MYILGIETSCDETALCILQPTAQGYRVVSELINSQISTHQEFGGVFPALAKREHIKNIYLLFTASLHEAGQLIERAEKIDIPEEKKQILARILDKDETNYFALISFYERYEVPAISHVAVTYGPGLEIALWTGFNFARAFAELFDITLLPSHHMEGHIFASLLERTEPGSKELILHKPVYPALSLLISGGHTELVISEKPHQYKKIGKTLDDAVGEAYDKSARLVGLPYPGGPLISKLAESFKEKGLVNDIELPRPMLYTKDYMFSFSGLKTAVRTLVQRQPEITDEFKEKMSHALEEAIGEVLVKKTKNALEEFGIRNLIIGGGVSANTHLRREFAKVCQELDVHLYLPDRAYTGDNGVMITVAAHQRFLHGKIPVNQTVVKGNLSLEEI